MSTWKNSAKEFEKYAKQNDTVFNVMFEQESTIFETAYQFKGQNIVLTIEFLQNLTDVTCCFVNVSDVDLQKRYELLEICNAVTNDNYDYQLTIDGDNDLQLYVSAIHGDIDVSPEWVYNLADRMLGFIDEKILPDVMKIIWS
ncbi:MAG: hypothetical protein ACRC17_01850 [Culicoidibacterales bacterium]